MIKPYSGDPDQTCPYRLGEACRVACPTCMMFQQFRGMHPQTGAEIDRWECSIAFLPFLTIENSNQQRQTAAAVESFRNEMVRSNMSNQRLLAEGLLREQAVQQAPQLLPRQLTNSK